MVFNQGDDGEYFYIIEDGEVECLKVPEDPTQELIVVRTLTSGDHFGELALLNDVKRSLSIRVKSLECKVLCLNREGFKRILGDINKYLKKDYNGEFDTKYSEEKAKTSPQKVSAFKTGFTIIPEETNEQEGQQ